MAEKERSKTECSTVHALQKHTMQHTISEKKSWEENDDYDKWSESQMDT